MQSSSSVYLKVDKSMSFCDDVVCRTPTPGRLNMIAWDPIQN